MPGMQLIADSGATKTAWRLIGEGTGKSLVTEGLNPYYHSPGNIRNIVKEGILPETGEAGIEAVRFYGAGCDGPRKREQVAEALAPLFPRADIRVHHDLLGAARACFLREEGLACIIGTGSNTCYYDGEKIAEHIPSLAFVLGDEGSAGWFGKRLINDYFRREVPEPLRSALEEGYNMDLDHITRGTYEGTQPSRFVASYAAFLGDHREHPYVGEMLREGFERLADRVLLKYRDAKRHEVRFVGAVAWSYRELISHILQERDMRAGLFLKDPMDRLVEYHGGPAAETAETRQTE